MSPLQACPEPALRRQDLQQTGEQSTGTTLADCLSPWEILLVAQSDRVQKGEQEQTDLLGQECQRKGGTSPHQPHVSGSELVSHRDRPGC